MWERKSGNKDKGKAKKAKEQTPLKHDDVDHDAEVTIFTNMLLEKLSNIKKINESVKDRQSVKLNDVPITITSADTNRFFDSSGKWMNKKNSWIDAERINGYLTKTLKIQPDILNKLSDKDKIILEAVCNIVTIEITEKRNKKLLENMPHDPQEQASQMVIYQKNMENTESCAMAAVNNLLSININADTTNKENRQHQIDIANNPNFPLKGLQAFFKHGLYEDAISGLEQAIDQSDNLAIKQSASAVLAEAKQTASKSPENHAAITNALQAATTVVKRPDDAEAINVLEKKAKNISQRSWGKILGGTMLALAGTALIVGCTAAALFSFGALAPVSILGFALGASMVTSGIAIGAGAVGLTASVVGSTMFTSGVTQGSKTRQLRKEMETLAKEAKPESKSKSRAK